MQSFAPRMANMHNSAAVVRQLFGSSGQSDLISFASGSPANETIPADIVHEIACDVLKSENRGVEALAYGPVLGVKDLREVIRDYLLHPYSFDVNADNILITVGGLESIYTTCQIFINPGDIILVEDPTFFHAMEIFDMFQARCIAVESDDIGMDVDDLEKKIRAFSPRLVYTIPTFQNPSGKTLPTERRKRIAELAGKYDLIVLEDDPYRELRYSGEDLAPIASHDKSGNVIYTSCFSKNYSAGSRIGYFVASDPIIDKAQDVKTATNSHTGIINQILCAEFFKRGYFPDHKRFFCDVHRIRRDAMMAALDKYLPEAKHTIPDGGLFTWVELPEMINTKMLRKESGERPDIKVAFTPGETFFTRDTVKENFMRLSFSNVTPEVIDLGVKKLAGLIHEKY